MKILRSIWLAAIAASLATASMAADPLPTRERYAPQAAIFDWTGFYVGAHAGWAVDKISASTAPITVEANGFFGGLHTGYNVQWGNLVVGLEGDVDFGRLRGSATVGGFNIPAESDLFGTFRGRVGYAFQTVLLYGTGGLAWSKDSVSVPTLGLSDSVTRWGWTAGGGLEVAFTRNWTMRAEYLYAAFPNQNYTFAGFPVSAKADLQLIRAGASYKF